MDEERSVRTRDSGYLSIARFKGDGERLLAAYRERAHVMTGVGRDRGLLLHVGARTEDGFLIVNLWPPRSGSERAAEDPRRLGVIRQIGITPDQVRREHHDVVHVELFEQRR